METKNKSELTLSEKLNGIVETTFKAGEIEPFLEIIKEEYGCNWKEEFLDYSGHIVYVNEDPKQIFYCCIISTTSFEIKRPYFKDYLKKIDCTDFNKLLLLSTTYYDYKLVKKPTSPLKSFYNRHVDDFLKETNGWLVYKHQLEKLYMMAKRYNVEQAITFARKINLRNAEFWEQTKELKVLGTSLYEILDTRLVFGGVCTPNLLRANNLFTYLNC
jgi:hypothetical protein